MSALQPIDYVRPAMQILEAWVTCDPVQRECRWATLVYQALGGEVVVPGFGAADDSKKPRAERYPAPFFRFAAPPRGLPSGRAGRDPSPRSAGVDRRVGPEAGRPADPRGTRRFDGPHADAVTWVGGLRGPVRSDAPVPRQGSSA